jgi:mannosyltransferase
LKRIIAGHGACWALAAIWLVASGLRLAHLGRLSLWYDEVVPMRLARAPSPAALFRLLFQIEATRAPLHPLVLQAWLRVWGPSDLSGRMLSALCGIATVALVFRIGRAILDEPTALFAAWLCAFSPLLVFYSQEVKMYSWLVFLTCLAWDFLVGLRSSASSGRVMGFALSQLALLYSHPLGGFMIVAQGLVFLMTRSTFRLSLRGWLVTEAVVALAFLPWLGFYLDHPPESTTGRLPIRFLLAVPIGFTGGDARILILGLGLIAWGFLTLHRSPSRCWRLRFDQPSALALLLIWFVVPPVLLYGYSRVSHPIFGPARYTLYVAPAYLLLLARGLAKLPRFWGGALALAFAALGGWTINQSVYDPELKADWRAASAAILRRDPTATVIVLTTDPSHNVEVETARYYLGPKIRVIPIAEALTHPPGVVKESGSRRVVFAIGTHGGRAVASVPPELDRLYEQRATETFPGLRLDWREAKRAEGSPRHE